MSPVTPPQVKDKAKLTKIFDWAVPIAVGVKRASVNGELLWTPETSKAPVGAIVALAIILIGAVGLTTVVRRRRRRRPGSPPSLLQRPGSRAAAHLTSVTTRLVVLSPVDLIDAVACSRPWCEVS